MSHCICDAFMLNWEGWSSGEDKKKYILYFVFELMITSVAGEAEFSLAYLLILILTDCCITCLMNMT